MKKSILIAGTAALIAGTAISSAHAVEERTPRWYLGLSGGYTYMADQDVSNSGVTSMSLDNGYGINGAIGYLPTSSMPLINALRFEAELGYHNNGVDKVKSAGTSANGNGNYSVTSYMVNALYDLPTRTAWSPYLGVGLGAAYVKLSSGSGVGNTGSTDSEVAYQGMVGVGYTPESMSNVQWSLGYKYLATTDPKFSTATSNINTEYSSHNLEIGAKFRF